MADYPSGTYSPRTKENKSGVDYDSTKKTVIFAEDISKLDDEVVAVETDLLDMKPATPANDHSAKGIKIKLTAAVEMAFGDVGYINANGKVAIGKADAIATASAIVLSADSTIAQDQEGNYLLIGIARDDTWDWTVGGWVYLSTTGTTGNTLTQTAPSGTDEVIQIVGIATHADRIYFKPEIIQIEHK
jgi:hypothetical protein